MAILSSDISVCVAKVSEANCSTHCNLQLAQILFTDGAQRIRINSWWLLRQTQRERDNTHFKSGHSYVSFNSLTNIGHTFGATWSTLIIFL